MLASNAPSRFARRLIDEDRLLDGTNAAQLLKAVAFARSNGGYQTSSGGMILPGLWIQNLAR